MKSAKVPFSPTFFFYTTSKHIVFISLIFKNQRYNKQNSIKKKKKIPNNFIWHYFQYHV